MPEIRYGFFISGREKELTPASDLWNRPLPAQKDSAFPKTGHPGEVPRGAVNISIGQYLTAAWRFLAKDDFALLLKALEPLFQKTPPVAAIDYIGLHLEKHGAFYHPIKVEIHFKTSCCRFVLNGAVSEPGVGLVQGEFFLIQALNQKRQGVGFLPKVHACGFMNIDGITTAFFLGQWFDGYKEFHLTRPDGRQRVVIWESDGSRRIEAPLSMFPVYRGIANILTLYYDIETFEQIHPWHNAAGDFVICEAGGEWQVRLVSARGYENLTGLDDTGSSRRSLILPAMMMFYLALTLRIRLDRLDGTGRPDLLDVSVLGPVTRGVLDALEQQSGWYDYGNLKDQFIAFFIRFDQDHLVEMLKKLLAISRPSPKEIPVLEQEIPSHCRAVVEIFKNL